jgi:prevent-host-death family protein
MFYGELFMSEQTINVADAKKRFSELLGKVAYGKEQIIITKRGRPMARLVPAEEPEMRLGDAEGWLDENDPFFDTIRTIIKKRKDHVPRFLEQKPEK